MAKKIANNATPKKRGNPAWKKGGVSPNPAGRPGVGTSRSELWSSDLERNAEDIAAELGDSDLGRMFRQMPKGVPMKVLLGRRVMASLMFEPQAALLNAVLDSVFGKIKDEIEHSGSFTINITGSKWTPN
jgi:hypothetical protein